MAEPNFEEYLREREKIEKRMNMERLMEEFKEDMRKKNVMEQKQMASNLENERLLEQLYEQFLEEGFSPEVAAEKARQLFDQMSKAKDKKDITMAKAGGLAGIINL